MKSLYPAFLGFFIFASSVVAQAPEEKYHALAGDIFRELININTTRAKGSGKAAMAMYKRLAEAGFDRKDLLLDGPDSLHLNLVARLKGTGKKPPVLFICHLDVVEALRSDWSMDPFSFTEKDGFFYGRGTTDIKCEDADLVTNFIRLKQEHYTGDRDLIIALTADEEGGSANGVDWLLKNRREYIEAAFAVNPDGGGGNLKNGIPVEMAVQTSEKIYAEFSVEVRNKGGHSSIPSIDNAIYKLSSALLKIADVEFPVSLNETTHKYLEAQAGIETGQLHKDILAVLKDPSDLEAVKRIQAVNPYYNAMLHTTCVATMVNAGHAENALPQYAHAVVNCRMLPDDHPEHVLAVLKQAVNDTSVIITCTYSSFIAPLSLLRDEVMQPVQEITASMWPGARVSPIMSTGATDGKYLRRSGIPVYGISGMFTDGDDVRAHGRDERIGVKEFYDGTDFMYRFMKAISTGN
jgi:acetylornithine deacetylase/succinyl-diaminopimelate desuccinylase-like protein